MAVVFSAPARLRILRGLLVQELNAGGRRIGPAEAWPDDLSLGTDGLGLDSLELLACGAAVNEFFRLHESGVEDYLLAERRLDGWSRIVAAGLADGTTGLTFRTSGSTGEARRCTHAHATLAMEADHWAEVFADRRRIVQLVPAQHIYGCLFTALLPDRLGVEVIDGRALSPGRLARALRADDLLVGFPSGWPSLLRGLDSLPAGIRAVSSTAALPAATHASLRAAGVAEVVEVYGSSETGGIAGRTAANAPFVLLPRWRAGPGDGVTEAASGIAHDLPDHIAWCDARSLRLLGRRDRAVQVGGINVFPEAVARRLADHPLVAEALVRLDSDLPEPRLRAFVTLRPPQQRTAARRTLDAWCRDNLAAAERPVRIDVGAQLPRNAMGKAADWAPQA